MSPTGENRLRRGVLVGTLVMMGVVSAAMAYDLGLSRIKPSAYLGALIIAFAIAWPLGHLAVKVARRLTFIRLVDTVVATIIVIVVTFSFLLFSALSGGKAGRVSGDSCGDGTDRRIVVEQRSHQPGAPIYWRCVSPQDYAAWVAKTPSELRRPTRASVTAERYFAHAAKVHLVLKSAIFGTIAALAGWLYAIGWRWSVRTDAL